MDYKLQDKETLSSTACFESWLFFFFFFIIAIETHTRTWTETLAAITDLITVTDPVWLSWLVPILHLTYPQQASQQIWVLRTEG